MLKKWWVRLTAAIGRFVIQAWPVSFGKMHVWRMINRLNARLGVELECTTFWGGRFVCNLRDLIQARICYTGVWEPSLTAFIRASLNPGDLFVDVGANIGYFSVLAARQVGPRGRVIAIEASPRVFARLQRNLALNGLTNVRAHNVAVAETKGALDVYAACDTNLGSTSLLASRGGMVEARVEALPLIDLLGVDGFSAARLIKIDIEGFEGPVLRHLLRHADVLRPDVVIVAEVSPNALRELDVDAAALFDGFAAAGFECAVLENDYDWTGWYDTVPRPAVRLDGVPRSQVDVVFARQAGHHATGRVRTRA